MATHKSAMKRIKTSAKRRQRNIAVKSSLKRTLKKFERALQAKDGEETQKALREAVSALDVAVRKGVIHPNKASQKKSRLTIKANALSSAAPPKASEA